MSLFEDLKLNVEQGKKEAVLALVAQALDQGHSAQQILQQGLIAAMDIVGAKMEQEEMFIPEVLRAAKTMEAGLEILKPLLGVGDMQVSGKVVMGTVKGDLHDIGKNLVAMLLSSAGFEVIDLGINVAPAVFAQKAEATGADFLGMSALLTTTMPMMAATIEELEKAGLRGRVRVLIGGAPVTQAYADQIGADGYASDAGAAIKVAKELGAVKA
ncbi:MAG: corrinoid protein [Thermoleophilia bacterium]|nr:corrinoid protein [Thermoleophilia bacterium]